VGEDVPDRERHVPAGFPPWTKLLEDREAMCDSVAKGFVRDEKVRVDDPLMYADVRHAASQLHRVALDVNAP
jgi:hypothetical protein